MVYLLLLRIYRDRRKLDADRSWQHAFQFIIDKHPVIQRYVHNSRTKRVCR